MQYADTPETEALAGRIDPATLEHDAYATMTMHAIRMERERNAAVSALEAIEGIYIDGDNTYEDWKAMGTIARKFLENV